MMKGMIKMRIILIFCRQIPEALNIGEAQKGPIMKKSLSTQKYKQHKKAKIIKAVNCLFPIDTFCAIHLY